MVLNVWNVSYVEEQRLPSIPFYAKRVQHNNIIAAWRPCTKLNSNGKTCTVQFASDGKQKEIEEFEIASNVVPSHDDIKKLGTRVIARNRKPFLPYEMKEDVKSTLMASQNDEFYPGIIAREFSADGKYCVFFDDGIVQVVEREHIRRVEDNTFDHGMCLGFKWISFDVVSWF